MTDIVLPNLKPISPSLRYHQPLLVAHPQIGETTVSGDNLEPVKPEKKDTVFIVRGQNRHQMGKLIGIDAPDGIVNINESEISILKLDTLARAAKWV